MRALGFPFCAVCRRVINETLTPHLPTKSIFKELKDEKIEKTEKIEKNEVQGAGRSRSSRSSRSWRSREAREDRAQGAEARVEVQKLEIELPKLDEIGGFIDPGDIVQRLDGLEGDVQRLEHFIARADRPDLARGALAAKSDVAARNDAPERRPKSRTREK